MPSVSVFRAITRDGATFIVGQGFWHKQFASCIAAIAIGACMQSAVTDRVNRLHSPATRQSW
jgi:hypothetical protein